MPPINKTDLRSKPTQHRENNIQCIFFTVDVIDTFLSETLDAEVNTYTAVNSMQVPSVSSIENTGGNRGRAQNFFRSNFGRHVRFLVSESPYLNSASRRPSIQCLIIEQYFYHVKSQWVT